MTPDQEARLVEVFQHVESDKLSRWERDRLEEWGTEYERHGANYFLSQKQWAIIDKIYAKIWD